MAVSYTHLDVYKRQIYTCGKDFGTPELFVGAATDADFIDCPEFLVFSSGA